MCFPLTTKPTTCCLKKKNIIHRVVQNNRRHIYLLLFKHLLRCMCIKITRWQHQYKSIPSIWTTDVQNFKIRHSLIRFEVLFCPTLVFNSFIRVTHIFHLGWCSFLKRKAYFSSNNDIILPIRRFRIRTPEVTRMTIFILFLQRLISSSYCLFIRASSYSKHYCRYAFI